MITILVKKAKTELQNNVELVAKIKRELRNEEIALDICKEYGFDIDILDGISIEFADDLEASAKTVDGAILLSSNLIEKDFEVMMRYAIHELVHAMQHMKITSLKEFEGQEYLDRSDELEAFQFQIEYEAKAVGEEEAEEYVDDLIEYHEIPEDEAGDKKERLMKRV